MSTSPPWLIAGTLVALGVAVATSVDSEAGPKGSANAQHIDKLTGQVLEILAAQGIPASRLKCMAPCPQIGTWPTQAGAEQAKAVAERVLLSTGYRPSLVQQGGGYVLNIEAGPAAPASADPALR